MKSKAEILDHYNSLISDIASARVKAAEARLPRFCKYHLEHSLDVRKQVGGEPNPRYNFIITSRTLGLCVKGSEDPETWNGDICEDDVDAQRCPYFELKVTKEQLLTQVNKELSDLDWLKQNQPDVYALAWVLEETPKLSWWQRLWLKLRPLRVRRALPVVPLLPSGDPK